MSILEKKSKYSLGIAFVTFRTKRMADTIEQTNNKKNKFSILNYIRSVAGKSLIYKYQVANVEKSSKVSVFRAPDPNDIIWRNLGATASEILKSRVITFSVTFLLLCVSFGAILGLKIAQYVLYIDNKIEAAGLRVISILISIVISSINLVLRLMIQELTWLEKHETQSSYYRSLMMKTVIAHLVNTNLLVVIAHVVVYEPRQAIYGKGTIKS
jgi:hypothetical protein